MRLLQCRRGRKHFSALFWKGGGRRLIWAHARPAVSGSVAARAQVTNQGTKPDFQCAPGSALRLPQFLSDHLQHTRYIHWKLAYMTDCRLRAQIPLAPSRHLVLLLAIMRVLLLPLLLLAACAFLARGVKVPVASAGKHHPGPGGLKTAWHRWRHENPIEQQHVVGMRIPRRYFVTKGEWAARRPRSQLSPAAGRPPADLTGPGCLSCCLQALERPIRALEPTLTRRGRMT